MSLINKKLQEKHVFQLAEVFRENGWDMQDESVKLIFDNFCRRLEMISDKDEYIDLIIGLTKDFLWIRSSSYERLLYQAYSNLFEDLYWKDSKFLEDKRKNIYICPLIRECDFGKAKSGTYITYLSQCLPIMSLPIMMGQQIRTMVSPKDIAKDKDHMKTLILVDDFVGTGETAIECLSYITKIVPEEIPIFLISIVIQKEGYERLRAAFPKVKVYYTIMRMKGITDKYSAEEVKYNLELMRNISKYFLKNEKDDNRLLGYGKSEALVAMLKTPNNTFPIYWKNVANSTAPFPRNENVKAI